MARPPLPPAGQEPPSPGIDAGALTMRLRLVEEKAANLNRKVELLESNGVSFQRKMKDELRLLDSDTLELKNAVEQLRQQMDLVIRELKLAAGKHELQTLQRYLDLWNPARFVTRDELSRMMAGTAHKESDQEIDSPASEEEEPSPPAADADDHAAEGAGKSKRL